MKRNSQLEDKSEIEQQGYVENMQKQISQLNLKLNQIEDQLLVQGRHQKKIIQQNDEYVQQQMAIQETIERLKNIFQNEQGEEITINLQTYLQQRVVQNVLSELKFNQVLSQLENKQREQIHQLLVKSEQMKDSQDHFKIQIENLQQEIIKNTALTHQNSLFKESMERIKGNQEKTEKIIQESLDKFWKYDQQIQQFASQISQKVEQHQIQDIQNQLKDNFVGINQYQSQFDMLLGKVNAKTDFNYFEEKFNYIDKDLLKKIDLKPSQIDLKLIETRIEQKLFEQQQKLLEYQQKQLEYQQKISSNLKEFEEKSQKEEEGLQKLQNKIFQHDKKVQISGVVTMDALQQKWVYIESLKDESIRIKQDQDAFRKQFKYIEERLAVKISKYEIDQLKNNIEQQYVKIPVFDQSVSEQKAIVKNTEYSLSQQLKERDTMIDKFREEQVQIIERSKKLIKQFQEDTQTQQNNIQREQDIQKVHLETCKLLAQKVDESLIYKASKIDLNDFISTCRSQYLDRNQLSQFIDLREEFVQMKKIESDLVKFKNEYNLWIDTFNRKMCFSFDNMNQQPIQFQWVEEMKDKIYEIGQIKLILCQKAEHSDLIRLFSQKANKNLVNNLLNTCRSFKKQMIYKIVSLQSFIKCMQSRSDLLPSQQIQLTKLLKWISFSSLEGDQDSSQEQSLKLSVTASTFLQMEKVSDSVNAKFKLFQKKVEEMGEAKFISSENKILDEYLSMIMQDPAHEEVYGSKQIRDMTNIVNQNNQDVSPQKSILNQTSMRPYKIRKSQKTNSVMADSFYMRKQKVDSILELSQNQHTSQDHNQSVQSQQESIQNQFTRETSTFYDPLSQFSNSQKNSPQQQYSTTNHFFPNDSLESFKPSSANHIKLDNKTINIGGSIYEVTDMQGLNKNINQMNANSTKSVQMNQYINFAISQNNSNNTNNYYNSKQAASLSIKTDQSRFQSFYNKNQYKKNSSNKQNSSGQQHHSASQSPQSSSSLSKISRQSFMSPNIMKKMNLTQEVQD